MTDSGAKHPHNGPYIGCTLSLTSKAQIRYKGILAGIDTVNCTLTLHKVQSFGTENRCPENKIPPTPGTYDLIIFNGHDIEDVTVITKMDQLNDPAIINAQKKAVGISSHSANNSGGKNVNNQQSQNRNRNLSGNNDKGRQSLLGNGPKSKNATKSNGSGINDNRNRNQNQTYNNQNRPQNKRNPAINTPIQNRQPKPNEPTRQRKPKDKTPVIVKENIAEKYKSEFDFETQNKKFDKTSIAKELEKMNIGKKDAKTSKKSKEESDKTTDKENVENKETVVTESVAKDDKIEKIVEKVESLEEGEIKDEPKKETDDEKHYYEPKKSFFDNISCEANDPKGERLPRYQERKLNAETFGIPEKPRNFYNNSSYRGNNYQNRNNYQNNRSYSSQKYNGYNNTARRYDNNQNYRYNNRYNIQTGYTPRAQV